MIDFDGIHLKEFSPIENCTTLIRRRINVRYKVSRQFFVDLSGKVSLFGETVFTLVTELEGSNQIIRRPAEAEECTG